MDNNDELILDDEEVMVQEPEREVMAQEAPKKDEISNSKKWLISIMSGLVALLVFSPFLFSMTNLVTTRLGKLSFAACSPSGRPTFPSIILHSVVFALVTRLLMW